MKKKSFVKLRVCAHCEWVFKAEEKNPGCPQCKFASYSARYVYGNTAYSYAKNQKPWKERKMTYYEIELDEMIERSREGKTK